MSLKFKWEFSFAQIGKEYKTIMQRRKSFKF